MCIKELSFSERLLLKKENKDKFRKTNKIWNDKNLNQSWSVGYVNYIMKEMYKDLQIDDALNLSLEEWEKFYTSFKNDNRKLSGRTKKELMEIALKLQEFAAAEGIKLTQIEAYNFVLIRVIDESFAGFQNELKVYKYLNEAYGGLQIEFSSLEDSKYAIDLFVKIDNDTILDAVQIKPISFLKGCQNNIDYCVTAYIQNYEKHKKYEELTGNRPYYIFYDENDNYYIYENDDIFRRKLCQMH
jgi:hypothetical protein